MTESKPQSQRVYQDPSYQRAYDTGYSEGYDLGYRQGMKDAVKKKP